MTIDEAIAQEIEIAKEQKIKYDKCPTRMRYCCEMCFHNPKCNEVAEYHKQIAEWLEELKANKVASAEVYNQGYKHGYNKAYKKAINDFAENVIQRYHELPTTLGYTEKIIKEIAKQLKVGKNNE